MKTIIVTIEKGSVTVQTAGFSGPACKAETADLEKALGATVRDTPTAEMFTTAAQATKQQTGR